MDMLPEPMAPVTYDRTDGGNRAFHNFFNDFSHIQDPNLRRRLALSEIDKVPFGMYHVRAVLVAGIGFFLDSYDIFAINLVTTFLGVVFWHGPPENALNGFGGNHGTLPTPVATALKASTSAGIVIGQILFGYLADVFGRRRMYGIELIIIVFSTLSCCLVSASPAVSFTGLMTFWRVMMGLGIGGDYPLSSVITSEFAPTRWRGAMMAAVFSMQGMGQLMAAVIALIVTVAFRDAFSNAPGLDQCDYDCQIAADRCWRIIVGVGALPACFALYYRITIPETPRYTFEVAKDVEKASADIKAYMASQSEGEVDEVKQARMKMVASPALNVPSASWVDLFNYFKQWRNMKVLIGTTMSWFFLDLAFYGLGLNNHIVLQAIGYADGANLYEILFNGAVGTIILAVAGSLPGYWTAIVTIDTFGRRNLQVFGFVFLIVIFCILGFMYHSLNKTSLLVLYVVANFFFNWGPNTTTFIVPGECYPTRYRSTGHGLSAAMGKIGAIIAQVISIPMLAKGPPENCASDSSSCSPWIDQLMQIFALFMLCGFFVSLLIPETKGITLEELAGEEPTSYNAGRNGSIGGGGAPPSVCRPWWMRAFCGGQPAGFFISRLNSRGAPRVGIMTSPELAAQQQAQAKEERWKVGRFFWRRKRRPTSGQSAEHPTSSGSSTAGMVPENIGIEGIPGAIGQKDGEEPVGISGGHHGSNVKHPPFGNTWASYATDYKMVGFQHFRSVDHSYRSPWVQDEAASEDFAELRAASPRAFGGPGPVMGAFTNPTPQTDVLPKFGERCLEDLYRDYPDKKLRGIHQEAIDSAFNALEQVAKEAAYKWISTWHPALKWSDVIASIMSREPVNHEAHERPEPSILKLTPISLETKGKGKKRDDLVSTHDTTTLTDLFRKCVAKPADPFPAQLTNVKRTLNHCIELCRALRDAKRKVLLEKFGEKLAWISSGLDFRKNEAHKTAAEKLRENNAKYRVLQVPEKNLTLTLAGRGLGCERKQAERQILDEAIRAFECHRAAAKVELLKTLDMLTTCSA
ncbi:hypothetical protein DL769_004624 [Monosporascus sp. CRB-8-3]|nr:hypothetical protein DL769_004624 [Monosporascus sp. CRB-8-3]